MHVVGVVCTRCMCVMGGARYAVCVFREICMLLVWYALYMCGYGVCYGLCMGCVVWVWCVCRVLYVCCVLYVLYMVFDMSVLYMACILRQLRMVRSVCVVCMSCGMGVCCAWWGCCMCGV